MSIIPEVLRELLAADVFSDLPRVKGRVLRCASETCRQNTSVLTGTGRGFLGCTSEQSPHIPSGAGAFSLDT